MSSYPEDLTDYELNLAIEFYNSPAGRQGRNQMPCGDQDAAYDYYNNLKYEQAKRELTRLIDRLDNPDPYHPLAEGEQDRIAERIHCLESELEAHL